MMSFLLVTYRELQNSSKCSNIGVDLNFGRLVGIPTPARVETIGKIDDLAAEYAPNG